MGGGRNGPYGDMVEVKAALWLCVRCKRSKEKKVVKCGDQGHVAKCSLGGWVGWCGKRKVEVKHSWWSTQHSWRALSCVTRQPETRVGEP